MNRRLHVLLAVVLCCPRIALAEIPVEGDRELLKFLHNVQVANLSMFRRGEMHIKYVNRELGDVEFDGNARVVWDGDHRYYNYTYASYLRDSPTHLEAILRPEGLIVWNASIGDHGSAEIFPKNKSFSEIHERLFPNGSWHVLGLQSKILIADCLDPKTTRPWAEYVQKLSVRREGQSAIVESHLKAGGHTEMIFSLDSGGNLGHFEEKPGNQYFISEIGDYEWVPVDNDQWRLSKLSWKRGSNHQDPYAIAFEATLEVSSFDPDPKIPADRFQDSSLKLPIGAKVIEHNDKGGRRYYIGGPPKLNLNDELNKLGDEAKKRGFSKPR